MKLVGAISAAVLSLSLGIGIPAYAQEQHDQQEDSKDKRAQDSEKKAQPEKPSKQEDQKAQEEKSTKPEEKNSQDQHAQKVKPEQEAQHAAGKSGDRIPADRFKANFGREHSFRVSQAEYQNHRFQYGGYWFGFASAWPSNWLYTQDVYVVEINGVYYLCNASYPGVSVTLSFSL